MRRGKLGSGRATSLNASDRASGESNTSATPSRNGRGRSTITDLLSLVESLATFETVGVTPLARELGVPVATAYRMLRTLERMGYVEQLQPSKEYRLTLKLFELGSQVASRTTIRDVAAVELERMAGQTGMTTNLGVLTGSDVLYVSKVETDDLLTLKAPPGSRVSATYTAMGKAMLAFDPRPAIAVVGEGPYSGGTEHAIRTIEELEAELSIVRKAGYAVDRQELALGLWCVAAPILGSGRVQQGAISVVTYRPTIDEDECARLGEIVKGFASQISKRLGDLTRVHFR